MVPPKRLKNSVQSIAEEHHTLFQESYIIGVKNLPNWNNAIVETGIENKSAILLYKKNGFRETKQWVRAEEISKIRFHTQFA